VLLIEDDEPTRALVGEQLAGEDYDVVAVESGERGLEAAGGAPPDVLLLDLHLGAGMQGTDILDAFREDPRLANVPIIVLSGSDGRRALADCLSRGAHDFLIKGYEPVELRARVAAAIRLKHLHDRLRTVNHRLSREALEDALTGLGNRRHGELELERMQAHAVRHDEGLAVMQIDVDGFKATNDTHGHAVGDALLQGIAHRLQLVLRREDVLVRWGGDEFVALLPNARAIDAHAVAQRLRRAAHLAATGLEVQLAASVSIGWSCVEHAEPENLLAQADAALYEAKRSGRDAVRPVAA
jgi:two-component system cell cycle response regulator